MVQCDLTPTTLDSGIDVLISSKSKTLTGLQYSNLHFQIHFDPTVPLPREYMYITQ